MAKEKSNLIKLTSNLSSFDYSKVGEPHYTDLKRNVASERGPSADANYEKLSADDGQFIQKKPGERYRGTKLDGGFLRGGAALKVERQIEDQERIGKFLTTPKGALFTIKQAILQRQNADKETNIYNPLSLNSSLIDTLRARPQRHVTEEETTFGTLLSFFRFLNRGDSGLGGSGNSISKNRDINKMKSNVDTFGGSVLYNEIAEGSNPMTEKDDASIVNKNGLVPFPRKFSQSIDRGTIGTAGLTDYSTKTFADQHDVPEKTAIFISQTARLKRVRNADPTDLNNHDTVHNTLLDTRMNHSDFHIHERRGELNSQQQRNKNFEIENNELIGDNTTLVEFSKTGPKFESEAKANKFFDIKSAGSRKLQVSYDGALGVTDKIYSSTSTYADRYKLPEDFIKFRIRDVINGRWIIFPAIFTSGITDNSQASYNPINYIGRPDAVHIYQNRTRNISFGFRVVALNEDDIPIIWEKMNALQGLTTPQFKQFFSEKSVTDNTRPVAPIINLTIGDMFDNTPGYFTSVSVNVANSSTWETKDGRQFPHVCDVTVEFTYIGKETPSMLGKHYEGIAGQRVEDRRKASAESIKRKEEFLKKQRDSIELRKKLANQSFADFLTENSNTPEARQRTKISGKLTNQITQGTPDFTIPENVNFNPSLTGGQQRQQGSGAYNRTNSSKVSTKFVDQVRPLSKFQTFTSLTTEQQKVKSDVMKATNGTGIL